jgi:hypothetical protein
MKNKSQRELEIPLFLILISICLEIIKFKNMESGNSHDKIMGASQNLMRRLPPNTVIKNLGAISAFIDDEKTLDDVQVKTDQPLGK